MESAKKIFQKRGYHGARMQEIADDAGINKAMLHYYFRSKEKLFDAVFREALGSVFTQMAPIFETEESFEKKLRGFFDAYISTIQKNPYLPGFVLRELSVNRDFSDITDQYVNLDEASFLKQLEKLEPIHSEYDVDPRHIIVNMIATAIFPFVAKPLLKSIFRMNEEEYDNFLNERKEYLPEFFINALKK